MPPQEITGIASSVRPNRRYFMVQTDTRLGRRAQIFPASTALGSLVGSAACQPRLIPFSSAACNFGRWSNVSGAAIDFR
jgi:hypothetical protein